MALIVTGGIAPSPEGVVTAGGSVLNSEAQLPHHRIVTDAVHQHGGKIALQILHAGRYSYQPALVAPSPLQAPINPFTPQALTHEAIVQLIADFARCASLAQQAGYDGVEIMGSEGYLINQFLTARTNQRSDEWGGDFTRRMRFALAIVEAVRAATGPHFILIYRQSMLDLVPEGNTLEETIQLAQAIEAAGATLINTGIGWHEARIPTIATSVPRAAFGWVTRTLRQHVTLPLIATNRINQPEVAQRLLDDGCADMISMARPFLADGAFVSKAQAGRAAEINTCIGCNQACLDQIFAGKVTSCPVNPRACHETLMPESPAAVRKSIAVVGAGPAGLAFAVNATQRGHRVTLFDAAADIGGQFNVARQIPGKEEFNETLRYYRTQLALLHVDVRLNCRADAGMLRDFDEIVLATGIVPRLPAIEGVDHPKVLSYLDVLRDKNRSASASPLSARAASALIPPASSATATAPTAGERRLLPRMGHRSDAATAGRPDARAAAAEPTSDLAVAAQGGKTGRRAGENYRLDSSEQPAGARRGDVGRRAVSAYRRRRAAFTARRPCDNAAGGSGHYLRRTGAKPGAGRAAGSVRQASAYYRRRGRRAGAGCAPRYRAGHPAGAGAVGGTPINRSTGCRISTSALQHFSTSALQHISTSAHQHISTSAHQHISAA